MGIDWHKAKTGHLIPLADGVQLHSRYEPLTEANLWAEESSRAATGYSFAVILGAGAGYHIEAFLQKWPGRELLVIDTRKELVDFARAHYLENKFGKVHVEFVVVQDVSQILAHEVLAGLLSQRNIVLKHGPSFQSDKKHFSGIEDFLMGRTAAGVDYLARLRGGLGDFVSTLKNHMEGAEESAQKRESHLLKIAENASGNTSEQRLLRLAKEFVK